MTNKELRALRQLLTLECSEAAEHIGNVTVRSWQRWESGAAPVPDDVAEKILDCVSQRQQLIDDCRAPVSACIHPTKYFMSIDDYAAATDDRNIIRWKISNSVAAEIIARRVSVIKKPRHEWSGKNYYYIDGEAFNTKQLSEIYGINLKTLSSKLLGYQSGDDISNLDLSSKLIMKYFFNGELLTINQISKRVGLSAHVVKRDVTSSDMAIGYNVSDVKFRKGRQKGTGAGGKLPKNFYLYNGKMLSVTQISELTGVVNSTVIYKLKASGKKHGDDISDVDFSVDPNKSQRGTFYFIEGEKLSVSQLSERFGISIPTINSRINSRGKQSGDDVSDVDFTSRKYRNCRHKNPA